MAALIVVCLLLSIPVQVEAFKFNAKTELIEVGVSLEPKDGTSGLSIDSHPDGGYYILKGYGEADDIRVLDDGLATVKVLEPPKDGFEIEGVAFSYRLAQVLVWGRLNGDANDTLYLYDIEKGVYDDTLIPNGTVPLVSIDQARLYADDLILVVAGTDVNGTSKVLIIETVPNEVHVEVDAYEDRTALHIENNGPEMFVLDKGGGLQTFETFNWTLVEEDQSLDAMPTVYEMHAGRFWTFGMPDGGVTIGRNLSEGFMYESNIGGGPVQGVFYQKELTKEMWIVTARPGDGGGSYLEFWVPKPEESWERFHVREMDKTVSFIHYVPGTEDNLLIGSEDGSIVQYKLKVTSIPEEDDDVIPFDLKRWLPIIIGVVVVLLIWRWMRKNNGVEGDST